MRIESLGTGPVEPTSEAYAIAKFAGWKLSRPTAGNMDVDSSRGFQPMPLARTTISHPTAGM